MQTEVILLEDIHGLGRRGDNVRVKPGYARNFLLPRNLALEATSAGAHVFQERERVRQIQENRQRHAAEKEAEKINKLTVTIPVQAGEDGKLFGSVTNADIAEAMAKAGLKTDKRAILLEEPLKELGVYLVRVKLFQEVEAKVRVLVTNQTA
ncbi:MAG: 50S ribosomal protein L9 [Candidatus Eisenbacteria bacterium]